MKKRPPIVLVFTGACALFPLYLLVQAWLLQGAGLGEAARTFLWPPRPLLSPGENVALLGLAGLAGFAVYQVRAWSWYLALGAFALFAAHGVALFVARGEQVSDSALWAFTAITVTPAVGLIVLLQREIRTPYFNPRIRWWEAEPRFPIDGSLAEGGRVLDISRLGLFVQRDDPPAEGTTGEWTLRIGEKTVPLVGDVAWISEGDGTHPAGFGLRFGALSPEARTAVEGILAEQRSLGKKEWGERAVRYPTDIRCGEDAVVLDISPGGMFVQTRASRRLGETVRYPLRHGRHELTVTGRVVWISTGEGDYPPGHGVRFAGLDADTRAMLGMLVHDLWRAHTEPVERQV